MKEFLVIFSASSTFAILGLGFLLGLKHATEADHLAAVSTMVSTRRSLWSSALVGGMWGLGHTIALFAAGVFVLLLNFQISETLERRLEFAVGIMLTLLGLNVLRKILGGGQLHFHSHGHGERVHAHPHTHEREAAHAPEEAHVSGNSPRALLIGLVHGLAGSAALMLLIIPTIPSRVVGLAYIIVFGVGSIGGMMLMSFLVGLPFRLTARRLTRLNNLMQFVAGMVSILIGLSIVYEKGVSEGLFA
jgi:ABC-type nickel/cobalt efflux system permease component RcnA